MITLTPSYAGYLEAYSPHSPDSTRIVAGQPGDVVEELSRWVDLDTQTTWMLVSLREREGREDREPVGWLLESETIKL